MPPLHPGKVIPEALPTRYLDSRNGSTPKGYLMGQRESRLSRRIMNKLREEDVFCFKVHGSKHMMAGLPDIIACVDGYFVGLEVKHPETEDNLSERQKYVQKQIRRANGISETVTSAEGALGVINRIRANQIDP